MKHFRSLIAFLALALAVQGSEKLVPDVNRDLPNASLIEALAFKMAYVSNCGFARWQSASAGCAIITSEEPVGKTTRIRAVAVYISIDDGKVYAHVDGRGEFQLDLARGAIKEVKKNYGSREDYPKIDAAVQKVFRWDQLEVQSHGTQKDAARRAQSAISKEFASIKAYDSMIITAKDGSGLEGLAFSWIGKGFVYNPAFGICR